MKRPEPGHNTVPVFTVRYAKPAGICAEHPACTFPGLNDVIDHRGKMVFRGGFLYVPFEEFRNKLCGFRVDVG